MRYKSNGGFTKLVTWLLLLYPILDIYGYSDNSVAKILSILFIILYVAKKKITLLYVKKPKYFDSYFVIWLFSVFLSFRFPVNEVVPRAMGVIRTYILFVMYFDVIDINYFCSNYKKVALVAISFFIFQEILYLSFGYRIPGIIPGVPLAIVDDASIYMDVVANASRSSSFFSEPAHFAQFLIPLLALTIFKQSNYYNILYAILITIILLLLKSGNSLVGLLSVACIYVCAIIANNRSKIKSFLLVISLAVLFIVAIGVYSNSEAGQILLNRSSELTDTGENNSGFQRIFRGYYVIEQFSSFDKILGINNFSELVNKINSSSVSYYFGENDFYFNVVQNMIIKTGYLGLICMLLLFLNLFKKTSFSGKAIIMSFVIFSFMAGLYFTSTMAVYMLIPLKLDNQRR